MVEYGVLLRTAQAEAIDTDQPQVITSFRLVAQSSRKLMQAYDSKEDYADQGEI